MKILYKPKKEIRGNRILKCRECKCIVELTHEEFEKGRESECYHHRSKNQTECPNCGAEGVAHPKDSYWGKRYIEEAKECSG